MAKGKGRVAAGLLDGLEDVRRWAAGDPSAVEVYTVPAKPKGKAKAARLTRRILTPLGVVEVAYTPNPTVGAAAAKKGMVRIGRAVRAA